MRPHLLVAEAWPSRARCWRPLTLGMRHQSLRYTAYDYRGTASSDYGKSIITPFVGVAFKPLNYISLYANYIEGLTCGEPAPLAASNRNEVFKPARTWLPFNLKIRRSIWTARRTFPVRQVNGATGVSGPVFTVSLQRDSGWWGILRS